MITQTFVRTADGNFSVCGHIIPRNIFLAMEPSYTEIENLIYLSYTNTPHQKSRLVIVKQNNKEQQHKINGEWDDGDRFILRLPDYLAAMKTIRENEDVEAKQIKKVIEMADSPRGKRKKEYPPMEDLVIAMWENLIEKKSKKDSGIEQIQKLRKAIKAKYPEEGEENAVNTDEEEIN
jgi:hypothetical protein